MRKVLLVLGSFALVAAVVPGCGSSKSDKGGSAAPIPKEELLDRMVSVVCDNIGPCCAQNNFTHDPAGCATLLEGFYGQFLTPLLSADGVQYDAAAAGECLNSFKSVAASCTGEPDSPACDRVFVGTYAEGASCQHDEQCKAPQGGSAYCSSDDKCVAEPRGKLGDGCSGTCSISGNTTDCSGGSGGASNGNATCYTNDGLHCGISGNCEPLVAAGQACTSGCVDGHYCDATCKPKLGAGGDCSSNWDACDAQTFCHDNGQCAAKQPNGTDCEYSDVCQSDHCDYSGATGKCAPDLFVSEAICSGQSGP